MNFDLKQLTSFGKKKTFKNEHFQINPDKYWNLLLVVFFILIGLGCAFGYYKFYDVNQALNSYTTKNETQIFDIKEKKEVVSLIEYFQKRESKVLDIKGSKIPVLIDPSL